MFIVVREHLRKKICGLTINLQNSDHSNHWLIFTSNSRVMEQILIHTIKHHKACRGSRVQMKPDPEQVTVLTKLQTNM